MIRAARLGWVAALLASLACADPVVDEDAGAAADVPPLPPAADQGGRPLDRGLVVDAAPPRADGAMVPVDAGGCIAGLCTVCGPDGRERATDDDDRCAAADCSVYEAYELASEGETFVCYRRSYRASRRCVMAGVCRAVDDLTACLPAGREEVLRAGGDCQGIDGCRGNVGPTLGPAPPGTPCPDGVCGPGGDCDTTLGEVCAPWVDLGLCGRGVHTEGSPYCLVAAAPGAESNCIEICSGGGGRCLLAWRNDDDDCQADDEIGCFDRAAHLLCRCSQP